MKTHALYPGSFDVFTNGHIDILCRAARTFSRVTVAVAMNRGKSPMFSVEERVDMINEWLATKEISNISVASFGGLTVNYARKIRAQLIVRGLRAVSDFEIELQMAMLNDKLDDGITTIFMAASHEFSFLSSSAVKEVARHGGPVHDLVPLNVEQRLLQRLREKGII